MYLVKELLHFCSISVSKCQKMPEHKIYYYDLTLVLEGEMTYLVNGTQIRMQKNDIIFLPPGTQRARLFGERPVQYVSFNFCVDEDTSFPFPHYLPNAVSAEIRSAALSFPTSHLTPNSYSKEKCMHLLGYILYAMLDDHRLRSNNEHVLKMIRYVDLHIAEKITLKDVSRAIGISREYASGLFSQEMKQTLTDYVNEQKMLLAKAMMVGENVSLSEVAASLGFENYHYFSRLFKKQFGVSPIAMKHRK